MPRKSSTKNVFEVWELPEALLYHIATFLAPAAERAGILCHKIAPLCKASSKAILEEQKSIVLWDMVLSGDYGIDPGKRNSQRRSCKRLRRSPVDQVRDVHKLLRDNTEIAYYYLWELCNSSAKNGLSKSKLCGILNEYGPHLMLNKTASSGGTFLVDVCRTRHATQNTVLLCVQELVERRGALVNFPTNESANSTLTALCVAAVRGMPKVVEYLLSKGASPHVRCSARFRFYVNSKRSLRCTDVLPLEFAKSMLDAELKEGASKQDTKDSLRAIKLLEQHESASSVMLAIN